MRTFVVHRPGTLYYAIHLLIWSNGLFYLADTIVEILQCVPRTKIWDPFVKGHCIDVNTAFVATAAVNVISDISILILPLFCVWRLQIPIRRKMGISTMFAAGVL